MKVEIELIQNHLKLILKVQLVREDIGNIALISSGLNEHVVRKTQ